MGIVYTINDREVSPKEWMDNKIEDGVYRIYYENGNLWYELFIVGGVSHGMFREYDLCGTLTDKKVFVNGKKRPDLLDNRLALLVLFGEVSDEVQRSTIQS